jgi:integrase
MSSESGKTSKTNVKYWEGRLYKRSYKGKDGQDVSLEDWYVTLGHQGKDHRVCLQTPIKALAAKRAKEAYMLLKAQGWDAMWAVYKVRKSRDSGNIEKSEETEAPLTVGDYIARVNKMYTFRTVRTHKNYEACFYKLISDIFNIQSGNEKYDYVNDGRKKRIEKIHAVSLQLLTQDAIESWKNQTLKIRMETNRGIGTTINSILRGCKNLFSRKILKAIEMDKKFVSPFAEISYLPEESHRYVTRFNAKDLIKKAQQELKDKNTKAYVIFLLALGAGLRRNEIDKLLWEQVDFERKIISIHHTPYFTPKTKESSSEISMAQFLAEELAWFKQGVGCGFVLDSDIQARPDAGYTHCRCPREYRVLYEWLAENGITERNPLHTLRKEFGAQICRTHGLYMASRALRHSSYAMTEKHYVDKTAPVVPDFF